MSVAPVIEMSDRDYQVSTEPAVPKRFRWRWDILALLSFALLLPILVSGGYIFVTNQPVTELKAVEVVIAPGTSVWEMSKTLKQAGVIRSELTLFLVLRYLEDPTQIKASTYHFEVPKTTRDVAKTLIAGEFDNNLRRVTFVEGWREQEYATVAATLPNITEAEFMAESAGLEGMLFPETYFVPEDITATELVALLRDTHQQRVEKYRTQIEAGGLSITEALILASIIEREANTPESMKMVAGIYLNRLTIGMPLQADASIEYVLDAPLNELPPGQLAAELRELDSPYNTYLYPNLPPTPIGNPGETALEAIANPLKTNNLYYITGNDGAFYYAETYDHHLSNIARYLRG